ncbi:MAG: TIR domain-containing protein [bacterium]
MTPSTPIPAPQPTIDVFIAYACPDKPHALALRAALRARGLRAFVDAADLLPGDEWDTAIPTALTAARLVAILVTPAWKPDPRWYALEETARAIALRRARPALRVVPVTLGDVHGLDVPYGLMRLVGVEHTEWPATAARLAEALTGRAELGGPLVVAPPHAPPPPHTHPPPPR